MAMQNTLIRNTMAVKGFFYFYFTKACFFAGLFRRAERRTCPV